MNILPTYLLHQLFHRGILGRRATSGDSLRRTDLACLTYFVDMDTMVTAPMGDIGRSGHGDVSFDGEWAQYLA